MEAQHTHPRSRPGRIERRRKLDRAAFVALSTDADEGVRHALANNAKLPPDLLRLLSKDPVALVSTEAQRRLDQRAATKSQSAMG